MPVIYGYREYGGSGFNTLYTQNVWWASGPSATGVWYGALNTGVTSVYRYVYPRSGGFSVRCVGI